MFGVCFSIFTISIHIWTPRCRRRNISQSKRKRNYSCVITAYNSTEIIKRLHLIHNKNHVQVFWNASGPFQQHYLVCNAFCSEGITERDAMFHYVLLCADESMHNHDKWILFPQTTLYNLIPLLFALTIMRNGKWDATGAPAYISRMTHEPTEKWNRFFPFVSLELFKKSFTSYKTLSDEELRCSNQISDA